jgi:hypothetical protein
MSSVVSKKGRRLKNEGGKQLKNNKQNKFFRDNLRLHWSAVSTEARPEEKTSLIDSLGTLPILCCEITVNV